MFFHQPTKGASTPPPQPCQKKKAINYTHPLVKQIIEACGFSLGNMQEFHLHVIRDEPVTAEVKHLVQQGEAEVSTYRFTEVQPVAGRGLTQEEKDYFNFTRPRPQDQAYKSYGLIINE